MELVHLDGFITKKKPIYRVAPKMYTHCTLILMSKECIYFFGPLCIHNSTAGVVTKFFSQHEYCRVQKTYSFQY
jgi:hypothetical protein